MQSRHTRRKANVTPSDTSSTWATTEPAAAEFTARAMARTYGLTQVQDLDIDAVRLRRHARRRLLQRKPRQR